MNPMHAAAGAVAGRSRVAIMLDYDGTLAPIAPHPDLALLPEATANVVRRLAAHALVAIVSGRSLANVQQMVGIEGIAYAGGHGLHILQRDGTTYDHPLPPETEGAVQELVKSLQSVCKDGVWIEDKGGQLTFHYREAPEHLHQELDAFARKAVEEAGLKVGAAHCAVEAKPFVQWHKGAACLHILHHEWGASWAENCAVVYAGDDTTDEDAFKALSGHGLTIRVTTSGDIATAAELRVPSTGALLEVLHAIADQLESQDG